jgi:hypothetical protein
MINFSLVSFTSNEIKMKQPLADWRQWGSKENLLFRNALDFDNNLNNTWNVMWYWNCIKKTKCICNVNRDMRMRKSNDFAFMMTKFRGDRKNARHVLINFKNLFFCSLDIIFSALTCLHSIIMLDSHLCVSKWANEKKRFHKLHSLDLNWVIDLHNSFFLLFVHAKKFKLKNYFTF